MVRSKSARVTRLRALSQKRQQIIFKRIIPKQVVQETKKIVQETVKKTQPTVDYSSAWDTAMRHFNKGMAGAYLYWMKRGEGGPQGAAVYDYLKELVRQQRSGNISPTDTKLAAEKFKLSMFPEIARQEQQAAIAKYNKAHPTLIANKYKLSTSTSDILSGKIFEGVGAVKADVPIEARLKPSDIAAIIRGKDVGKIITEKVKILKNVVSRETSKFNTSLKNSSKELPSGVSFAKDNKGNIIYIIDRNINRRVPLNLLNRYINDDKLIKLGLGNMTKFDAIKLANEVKITKSSDPNRLIVVLPNGVKGTINAKGRTVIGKLLGGHKYTFQDGVLRKINDVDLYEKKLKPTEVPRRDRIRSMQRAKDLSKQWGEDISTTKISLKAAAKRGDSSRLAELQRLGKNRSPSQNIEMEKLQTEVAKNYRLGGELVGKIIGTSLINMGVGSIELFKALKVNPKETLIALPPAIYEGVREDFNRVMSGDPLEIVSVGLEFWTFGKVGKIAGKVGKTGLRTSYGIGSTLSPKYIGAISNKLFISPVTLRGIAIKTASGRAVESAIKNSLKQSGVTGKVTAFNKKLKAGKSRVDRKLSAIQKKARVLKGEVKEKGKAIVENLESRTNINKQYKRAKQNFKKSMDKKTSVTLGNDDYIKAVVFIEELSSNIAKVKANKFLRDLKSRGGKIGLGQEGQFVRAVQNNMKTKLNSLSEFKKLKETARLKKSFQINLRKRGKIEAAKITFRKIKIKIEKLSLVKKMTSTIRKITAKGMAVKLGVKRVGKKVGKGIRKVKKKGEKITANLESRTNLNKQYNRARKNIRKSLGGKIKIITIGNNEYIKAVAFIEQFSNNVAKISAKKFLRDFKAKGGKIGLGQEEKFINAVQKNFKKTLDNTASFKKLKEAARFNKPFQIKLARKNKLNSAKRLSRNLASKIKSTRAVGSMTSIIKRVSRGVRDVKKKVSPKRIKRRIKRRIAESTQRRFIKKTIRYQMEQARPIRKVSFDKLKRSQKVSNINKFIDNFFNELGRRQKIDITSVQFSQMKNILKKRMRNAINKGNLPEINNFRIEISKLLSNMNKKASNPDIKIIKTAGKDRRIRTIKDFESKSPKGTYREVKVGNQVMLQEVKQIRRTKQVQAMQQPIQKYKIVSVQKKAISLKPLMQFGVKSLSEVALKNMSKQAFGKISNQGQLIKVLQDSAQDFKVLQVVGQSMSPKVNVASAVASAVNSRVRSKARLKTKQVLKTKKKPIVRIKFKKEKATRKLSKPVQTYAFAVKKSGKWVRLKSPPMTLADAWSAGSYVLDHKLQRSGKLIPVGLNSVVAKLGKNVAGYYGKHQSKFRRARIKKGKVLSLERTIIEKKKYVGDTLAERLELQKARKKAMLKKRKPAKRKPTKRVMTKKKLPTLNSIKATKQRLILKRRRMVNKLKNS